MVLSSRLGEDRRLEISFPALGSSSWIEVMSSLVSEKNATSDPEANAEPIRRMMRTRPLIKRYENDGSVSCAKIR